MSGVIPLFRLRRETAADPISIPAPPCGRGAIARRFEAVPGQAATWSIRQSGRFIEWLRHTQDVANGGAA